MSEEPETLQSELAFATETVNRFVAFVGVLVGQMRRDLSIWAALEDRNREVPAELRKRVHAGLIEFSGILTGEAAPETLRAYRIRRNAAVLCDKNFGLTVAAIAEKYGLSKLAVSNILKCKNSTSDHREQAI